MTDTERGRERFAAIGLRAELEQCQACVARQAGQLNDLQRELVAAQAQITTLTQSNEALTAQLKKAVNMARHNYQSAVHEQFNAEAHGHRPSPDYPPLVDDEFAAQVQRAETAEAERDLLRTLWSTR